MPPTSPVAGTYQHYKGGLYEVLGVADEPESGRRFVVYRSLGVLQDLAPPDPARPPGPPPPLLGTPTRGELTVCSVARFTEDVDGREFAGGRRVPRFRLLAPPPGD